MGSLQDKFRRAGGMEMLRRYADSHVLLFVATEALRLGLSQKSLEIVRLCASNKVLGRLRRQYRPFIARWQQKQADRPARVRKPSDKVWVLWMDGMENAPQTVRMCYESLVKNLHGREIVLLTEKNLREYVQFPDYIEARYRNGAITKTHLSDLIRLELLIRYGGTWVDATVFCTGRTAGSRDGDRAGGANVIPAYMLESDLFLFQDLKPGLDGHCQRISSWFITASSHSPILELTRALLYQYWKTHDRLNDYYLFHDFFELAIEACPEEWAKVIPCSNAAPHILLLRLFEPFDREVFDAVCAVTPFHKLTYKFEEGQEKLPGTYYDKLSRLSDGQA